MLLCHGLRSETVLNSGSNAFVTESFCWTENGPRTWLANWAVKAGLSEMDALQAAALNPARTFNLADQGTIRPKMRADLVLLDSNPLENIDNTRKIRTVVAAGRVFMRGELDTMLSDIQKEASRWTGTPTR